MKIRVFISLIFACIFSSACSDSFSETYYNQSFKTDYSLTKSLMSDTQVDAYRLIEDGYIEMVDYQYRIKINESEACELGYSILGYRELQSSLDEANKMLDALILSYESDSTVYSYTITDCTYGKVNIEPVIGIPSVKTSQEGIHIPKPEGRFDVSDNRPYSATFFAPYNMTGVIGECYCKSAPFGINTLSTKTMGMVYTGACVYVGTITLDVAASNTNVTVTYQTTDSNGGICNWRGRY